MLAATARDGAEIQPPPPLPRPPPLSAPCSAPSSSASGLRRFAAARPAARLRRPPSAARETTSGTALRRQPRAPHTPKAAAQQGRLAPRSPVAHVVVCPGSAVVAALEPACSLSGLGCQPMMNVL